MNWCFAKINNKLAEIYFKGKGKKLRILGHTYIKPEEYKTKREQKWIIEDTAKFQFSYKDDQYIEKHKLLKGKK